MGYGQLHYLRCMHTLVMMPAFLSCIKMSLMPFRKLWGLSLVDYFGYLQSRWEELAQYEPLSDFPAEAASIVAHDTPIAPTATIATGTPTAFHVRSGEPIWVLDSGANDHMTGESSIFSPPLIPVTQSINLADGSTSHISHKGDVFLSSDIMLSSILHILNFAFNLLSVSCLAKSLNCAVIFLPFHCLLQDLSSKKIFGRGYECDGLYYFGDTPPATSGLQASILPSSSSYPSSLKDKSFRDNNTNNNNSKITTFSTGSSANGKCQLGSSSLGKKSITADIVVEDDESPNSQATASASSFDRKVSRSRSVGCGSRSFSGDFFERISTGFGDCTLRRVESQRHPKTVNAVAHEVPERHGLDLTSQSFFDLSSAASSSISASPLRLRSHLRRFVFDLPSPIVFDLCLVVFDSSPSTEDTSPLARPVPIFDFMVPESPSPLAPTSHPPLQVYTHRPRSPLSNSPLAPGSVLITLSPSISFILVFQILITPSLGRWTLSLFLGQCLQVLQDPKWVTTMQAEIDTLQANQTWEFVPLPFGFTQILSKDFGATFAPVAKLTSVRLLVSLAASHSWPLHQLDVKNAFLHGNLLETIYMDLSPGFRAEGEYVGKVPLSIFLVLRLLALAMESLLSQRKYTLDLLQDTGLSCFTDADYAGSQTDRRSTTGLSTFYGNHLISWKSK
uniref:Uncharacterized protein n=1 Tax=Fagus sylvatica TaxID=28930 RepID=A0A2N9J4F8_FAGSY